MAHFILKNLRDNQNYPWCRKMLARVTLPPTVHHHAHFRVWQRRFYYMNIWTPEKRNEKLIYMHNNPVKRGLVKERGDWSRVRGIELAILFFERRFKAGDG
jgi:hypothetical protein